MTLQLSLENFLSFAGKHEVCLDQLSSIIFQSSVAKDDLNSALAFVFGAELSEFGFAHPDEFISEKYRKNFPKSGVTSIVTKSNNVSIKFSRYIIAHGVYYSVDDRQVTFADYKYRLRENGFPLTLSKANICITESLLEQIMCDQEGLEEGFSLFMENKSLMSEIRSILNQKKLAEAQLLLEKPNQLLPCSKKSSDIFDEFQPLMKMYENIIWDLFKVDDGQEDVSEFSLGEAVPASQGSNNLEIFEQKSQELSDELAQLKQTRTLYEAELFKKVIKHGKTCETYLQQADLYKKQLEEKLISVELEMSEMHVALSRLSDSIQFYACELEDQRLKSMRALISPHSTLSNFQKTNKNRFLWLLKSVLGVELFNSHLIESSAYGNKFLDCLRNQAWDKRESFLPLDDCLTPLIDQLIDEPIDCSTLAQVQCFLIKLVEFNVISKMPVFVKSGDMPDEYQCEPETDLVVFVETGEFVKSDGTFGKFDRNPCVDDATMEDASDTVTKLVIAQEIDFEWLRKLEQRRFEYNLELTALKEELMTMKKTCPKSKPREEPFVYKLSPIWSRYKEVFEEYFSNCPQELTAIVDDQPGQPDGLLESEIADLTSKLQALGDHHEALSEQLMSVNQEALEHFTHFETIVREPKQLILLRADMALLNVKSKLKIFKNILTTDDVQDFDGSKQCREKFFAQLREGLREIKAEVKLWTESWKTNKTTLSAITDFCSSYAEPRLAALLPQISCCTFKFVTDDCDWDPRAKLTISNCPTFCNLANIFVHYCGIISLLLSLAIRENRRLIVVDVLDRVIPRDTKGVIYSCDTDLSARMDKDQRAGRFRMLQQIPRFIASFRSEDAFIVTTSNSNVGVIADGQMILYNKHEEIDGQLVVTSAISQLDIEAILNSSRG